MKNKGFFKAYDMRGTFGTDFDLATVEKVGRALPKVVEGRRWLVGRDCRTTSRAVRDALVRGLVASGTEVTDLGLCTTPMVYHFTDEGNFDGSVMITASHNPPTDNGLKVSKRTALPVGYADGLNRVEELVAADTAPTGTLPDAAGLCRTLEDPVGRYVEWMKSRLCLGPSGFDGIKFAVDCSNGMSSLLARRLFPNAVIINDEMDGRFPAHSPNPLKPEARAEISRLVREKGLDCGVIFDGDADRAMFVDEEGRFIQPDYLIPVVATAEKAAMRARQIPVDSDLKIIHDVRTSRGAIAAIQSIGARPVMVPVGHAFAKPILRRENALCGGELAGHYYFREFHGCDSGVLAALRVLEALSAAMKTGTGMSGMMRSVFGGWSNSGEINFKVEDKDAAIERVLKTAAGLAKETSRSEMDGYRLEYEEGWISVRKSNTEPYLRLIVETDTEKRLEEWLGSLKAAVEGK